MDESDHQPKKTKKKQKWKKEKFKEAASLVDEEALSLEETVEVNKDDRLEKACSKVERTNRRKTAKVNREREKSDVAMFDEIVGNLINELEIFEITQIEGHSDEEMEISARATEETIQNFKIQYMQFDNSIIETPHPVFGQLRLCFRNSHRSFRK